MNVDKLLITVVTVLAMFIVFPSTALAYMDPGTGSLLLQIVAGALFGALFFLKMFWHRIVGFFRPGKRDRTDDDLADEQ